MNILIIIPHSDFVPTLPLGPLSIASHLNSHGHTARICDCLLNKNEYKKYLTAEARPDLVAISIMSYSGLEHARFLADTFRRLGIPAVWGGGYTNAYYDVILDNGCADYVSMGDGELSLTQLADALASGGDLSGVSGLIYKKDGRLVKNEVRSIPAGELPRLDLTLVDPKKYAQPFFCTEKMVHLYLSKGCPFNCTFCNRELIGNTSYRSRNLDDVVAEIRYLVDECGCDGIYFYDELWCINKKAAYEFCDRINKEKLDFKFGCFARIGQYDRETFQRLYDSGCRWILFGIESGSKALREKLNKYIDDSEIYETFEICHELGIITQASFMVGIPGETEEDLQKTVDVAFGIHADLLPFSNFTPVRGSALYKELIAAGKLKDETDIDKLSRIVFPYEKIVTNYSEVPVTELNVVRAFFRWCGFSASSGNLSGFEIAKEIAVRYLTIMFSGGGIHLSGIRESFTVLTDVVFNVFLHPKIRKKYGLYKKNFKYPKR